MENKINIAELLKDCPQGMELDCTSFDDVQFISVEEDGNSIRVKTGDIYRYFTKFGTWSYDENAKCVIFPKGKTTWEGFQRPFKDGDIVFYNNTIAIFKEWGDETLFRSYVIKYLDKTSIIRDAPLFGKSIRKEIRFATEEEKAELFQAIKENGYKWNEETKTCETLPKFKDGDILAIDDTVYIYNGIEELSPSPSHYVYVIADKNGLFAINTSTKRYGTRFATEEEKNILFEAIKNNGYRWDEETKTLVTLPMFKVGDRIRYTEEDFPIKIIDIKNNQYHIECFCDEFNDYKNGKISVSEQNNYILIPKFDFSKLKPFDKVLVRDFDNETWEIDFFSKLLDGKHFKCLDLSYVQCIPYEGNEHLFDTTNKCDDYFRIWED